MSQDKPAPGAQNSPDAARTAASAGTQARGRSGPAIVVTLLTIVVLVSSFVIWRLHQLRARIHAGEKAAPRAVPSPRPAP